jgi:hypothetical protein
VLFIVNMGAVDGANYLIIDRHTFALKCDSKLSKIPENVLTCESAEGFSMVLFADLSEVKQATLKTQLQDQAVEAIQSVVDTLIADSTVRIQPGNYAGRADINRALAALTTNHLAEIDLEKAYHIAEIKLFHMPTADQSHCAAADVQGKPFLQQLLLTDPKGLSKIINWFFFSLSPLQGQGLKAEDLSALIKMLSDLSPEVWQAIFSVEGNSKLFPTLIEKMMAQVPLLRVNHCHVVQGMLLKQRQQIQAGQASIWADFSPDVSLYSFTHAVLGAPDFQPDCVMMQLFNIMDAQGCSFWSVFFGRHYCPGELIVNLLQQEGFAENRGFVRALTARMSSLRGKYSAIYFLIVEFFSRFHRPSFNPTPEQRSVLLDFLLKKSNLPVQDLVGILVETSGVSGSFPILHYLSLNPEGRQALIQWFVDNPGGFADQRMIKALTAVWLSTPEQFFPIFFAFFLHEDSVRSFTNLLCTMPNLLEDSEIIQVFTGIYCKVSGVIDSTTKRTRMQSFETSILAYLAVTSSVTRGCLIQLMHAQPNLLQNQAFLCALLPNYLEYESFFAQKTVSADCVMPLVDAQSPFYALFIDQDIQASLSTLFFSNAVLSGAFSALTSADECVMSLEREALAPQPDDAEERGAATDHKRNSDGFSLPAAKKSCEDSGEDSDDPLAAARPRP